MSGRYRPVGVSAIIAWHPEGEGTGKRKRSVAAEVLKVDYKSPHDGPPTWEIEWSLNAAITRGVGA